MTHAWRNNSYCYGSGIDTISTHTPHAGRNIEGAYTAETMPAYISTHTPHAGRNARVIV